MKKIFSVCLALSVVCLFPLLSTTAAQTTPSSATDSEYTIDTPYVFPVTPADPEWRNFNTKQEMDASCQIPERILTKLTTRALLETVLSYPFMSDYILFNHYTDAAKNLCNTFNGFEELLSREDLTSVLLAAYNNAPVLKGEENEENIDFVQSKAYFRVSDLEFIIAYDKIINGDYSAEEERIFQSAHSEKMNTRKNMGECSSLSETYLSFMSQENRLSVQDTTHIVYTPKGSPVSVTKYSGELTAVQKAQINAQMASAFPKATRVAEPTIKYNCHSYAWYQQSTSNPYWMVNPNAYMTDGSYIVASGTKPRVGFRAFYYNGDHSAVVHSIKVVSGAQTIYYRSKWGSAGVYEHTVSHAPYASGTRHYYKA